MDSFLQDALDFNEDDLLANRSGALSDRQRAYLEKRVRRTSSLILLGFALSTAVIVGMIAAGAIIATPDDQRATILPAVLVVIVVMALVDGIGYSTAVSAVRKTLDVKVEQTAGAAQLINRGEAGVALQIGTQRFTMGLRRGFSAEVPILAGTNYTAYFIRVRGVAVLLSLETA